VSTVNTLTRTIRITVNDGDGGTATSTNQNVNVALTRSPIIDLDGDNSSGNSNGGFNTTFTEDDGAVAVADTNDTVITDDGTFKSLTITLTNRPDDIAENLSSTFGTGAQTVNSEAVTFTAYNSSSGELVFTVDDMSTDAATMELLIESVRYDNSSQAPDTTDRSITFVATDNADNAGPAATTTVTITGSNDLPAGSVTISGTLIEGNTLTADTSTLADADGLAAFSYQWQRNGTNINGATTNTYILMAADTGTSLTVTVSYTDGGGTAESITSAATITIDGDLDNDGIGDSVDADIDGDGMSNVWEDANGLNKLSAADANTDMDSDGINNLAEFIADTDPGIDDYPPLLTPPADISMDATGLFTAVNPGTASATDALDGTVTATSNADAFMAPGRNIITWTARDNAGNAATAIQTIDIRPLAEFSIDQTAGEGAAITVNLLLNGTAPDYPVTVPYTVSGSATQPDDFILADGTVTLTSGTRQTITLNIINDGIGGEANETIIITMGTPNNAVAGVRTTHTITIEEGNLRPEVNLIATQAALPTLTVAADGGVVTVTAQVTDTNPGDSHSLDWSASDNSLVDQDVLADTFSFDPTGLVAGLYTVRVTVTDDGIPTTTTTAKLIIKVIATAPILSTTQDSDGDGSTDASEGNGDSDGDGVEEYRDAISATNVLAENTDTQNTFLIETEAGLNIHLGLVAFASARGNALVTVQEIVTYSNSVDTNDSFLNTGGIFDFRITRLPQAGTSINVVIPQRAMIPADPLYRKLMPNGWSDYVLDQANALASTLGSEGYCPPPGDVAYQPGLTAGDWCVQLTIEDGGPNDADGEINRVIEDPGGVAQNQTVTAITVKSSGGGSFHPLLLLPPAMLVWFYRRRRQCQQAQQATINNRRKQIS